jgi:hypothetical protein
LSIRNPRKGFTALGVNVRVMVQLVPAERVFGQLLYCVKAASEVDIPLMVRGPLWLFIRVTL